MLCEYIVVRKVFMYRKKPEKGKFKVVKEEIKAFARVKKKK